MMSKHEANSPISQPINNANEDLKKHIGESKNL